MLVHAVAKEELVDGVETQILGELTVGAVEMELENVDLEQLFRCRRSSRRGRRRGPASRSRKCLSGTNAS